MLCLLWFGTRPHQPGANSAAPEPGARQRSNAAAVATPAPLAPKRSARNDAAPLPAFVRTDFLNASLGALAANGADLSLPMPSRHRIRSESLATAQTLAQWAEQQGFTPSPIRTVLGHGGVPLYDIDLIVTEVPDINAIQNQGRLIITALNGHADAHYRTWVGEIVSSSTAQQVTL